MESKNRPNLTSLLEALPPVEFCCVYGSSLHQKDFDKSRMIDFILGVANPQQWHAENLEMNRNHYASWMVHLGGARLITDVADDIGVGVHFNPFVSYRDRLFKYGVVRMNDLVNDILKWDRFYLSGRLQKPVDIIVDDLDVVKLNSANLKSAVAAALLLLPTHFSEEELYAKICSLSYMGDLRMIFAEDKHKVKKIVEAQFQLFQAMYKPILEEFAAQDMIRMPNFPNPNQKVPFIQDCSMSSTSSLVSCLPWPVRREMGIQPRGMNMDIIKSKEEGANRMQKVVRRKVMVSSARQAVSGVLTAGFVNGFAYLGRKMVKAFKSRW